MKTVIFIIKNHLGEIQSSGTQVTDEQLDNIINLSKSFYAGDVGFELWTDDSFVVIPPEITKQSILTVKILEEEEKLLL